MGIKVTDQEIETQLNQVKEQYGLADEQKYQAELAKAGITDAQVRDQVRISILTNKIYEAVIKKVTVSDADIQAYYDKNPTKYQQPASREVRHILVKNEALAQKLHDQIQGGADFAELAKKYTQDTASKADGGKFTAFKGRTVGPFDEFVFSAKTGDLSDPIKTEFGWHIIEGPFGVAAAQVLVYGGAVMVMFLFVIAYLGDRSEDSPWSGGPSWQIVGAVLAGGALLAEVCVVVGLKAGGLLSSTQNVDRSFGSPEAIGKLFLTDHLLAFEITSVVLLVAAVGGVVLGSHARQVDGDARA